MDPILLNSLYNPAPQLMPPRAFATVSSSIAPTRVAEARVVEEMSPGQAAFELFMEFLNEKGQLPPTEGAQAQLTGFKRPLEGSSRATAQTRPRTGGIQKSSSVSLKGDEVESVPIASFGDSSFDNVLTNVSFGEVGMTHSFSGAM